jgi:hypothetical protein
MRARVTMTVDTEGAIDDVAGEVEGALSFAEGVTLNEIEQVLEVVQTREEMQAEAERLMEEISEDDE